MSDIIIGGFHQILQNCIPAAVTVMIVVAIRFALLRTHISKRFLCLLWLIALVRFIMPSLPESRFSLIPETAPVISLPEEEVAGRATVSGIEAVDDRLVTAAQDTVMTEMEEPTTSDILYKGKMTDSVPYLWATGILFCVAYTLFGTVRLRRTLTSAVKKEGNERVYYADGIRTAFVFGLIRPRIYLPSALRMETEDYVLRHEQMHIRHGDHLAKMLSFVVLCVYWFHPAAWIAYLLFEKDMEYACDEATIKDKPQSFRISYADALLDCAADRCLLSTMPLAFSANNPKRRITQVLQYRKSARVFSAAAVLLLLALTAGLLTNPRAAQAEETNFMAKAGVITEPLLQMTEEYHAAHPEEGSHCLDDGFYISFEEFDAPETLHKVRLQHMKPNPSYREYDEYYAEEDVPTDEESISRALRHQTSLHYMYPNTGLVLIGDVASVFEEQWDGLRVFKVTLTETEHCPESHYVFVIDDANGYVLQVGGTLSMDRIETITKQYTVTVTDQPLDVELQLMQRALDHGLRFYCANIGVG